ncbi:PREDICTED: uncharacterized protein LOC107172267 [Diuraphis noxia]|uniref:uncharacterized protein LOC107172267 n=1 Tax=Diuraphis noxia TaxID=143948 RepID=UPI0007638D5F|nr:PREDICTED: uncharacterized protein LOC107172267 [Diuraphis noxia]
MSSIYVFALSLVCVIASAVIGIAASESPPGQQQQQIPQQRQEDDVGSMGLGAVLWSVLDDCYGDVDSVTVCLKSKALTAHDRAPGKPALTSVDGVTLAFRAGKSLDVDPQADLADRAALDAAPDADSKNVLLNDMLANRIDRLMSTRTVELDGAGQEGERRRIE